MSDFRTLFIRWYNNSFAVNDKLYADMASVCEDSPWHREINVAVHTNMVVGEYLAQVENTKWSSPNLIGAFACAFHDVGKPAARTEAYKPERGVYYRYGGHELISARLWEDWAVRNWKFLESEFNVSPSFIYRVSWFIQSHLPWDIKKAEKRRNLALGAIHCGAGSVKTFIDIVKADTWGRISDDATEKRAKVLAWCDEFTKLAFGLKAECKNVVEDLDSPILYVPIGVSGSGKSTLYDSESMDCVRKVDGVDDILRYSLDVLRLEWYDNDNYANAFKLACDDKSFNSKADAAYVESLQSGRNVYLDNMNLSQKSRAKFTQKARQYGYRIYAILLPIALQDVLARQETRTDKTLPTKVVEDMYMRLSIPSRGEVDRIITYSGNLPNS